MDDDHAIIPVSDAWLSVQTDSALSPESVNAQLLILQTAYPTVVRNYDEYEFRALQSLWYDVFKNVPEELLKEAIRRFIVADRKGFFPSPGQIIGYIEQIVKEDQARQAEEENVRAILRARAIQEKINAGECCRNCQYFRAEKTSAEGYVDEIGCMVLVTKPAKDDYYCGNENSREYGIRYEVRNAAGRRCDLFLKQEKQEENNVQQNDYDGQADA